jgi:hypothetical protein
MEIKVVCDCGTKYKFDVEPIDGHMPQPVKCPACGAHGTAQANAAIQEALTGAPVQAPAAAVAPAASRLRISVQQPASASPVATPAYQPGHLHAGSHAMGDASSVWKERGKKGLALLGKGVALLLILIAMLLGFGGKKGKRVRFLAKLTSMVLRSDEDSDAETLTQWNLWGQDIVLLLVRHTNETEVAEACTSFWQDNYKKKVTFVATNDIAIPENQIGILPPHNGCVQIVGGLKWAKEDFEKLTQQLSQKFNTVAVATRDVDFSGAYVFGVYEGGEKKFRAEMQIKGTTLEDIEEVVTVEGKQWALDHGFKPDKEEGWDGFYLADGDNITQKLGFKLWDKEEWDRCLVLTEITSPRPARVLPASATKPR